jgi:hypothetical protein
MTEAHAAAPGPGHPSFSEAEWDYFQSDDRHAAATVILLMTAIFTIGLFLYGTIAYIVAS